jgi:DNA mismatch endonuclease, patch repair protein
LANKGKDTKLELRLRNALIGAGIRRFKISYPIGGTRVDLAFPSQRVAVLVNGCFWHNCRICRLPMPKTNREFWATKFRLTRLRDARARSTISRNGWILVELWEHQVRDDLNNCVDQVAVAVMSRKSSPRFNDRKD